MDKKYSLLSNDFSRAHPMAIIALIALVLAFITSGIFRLASTIVLIIAFFSFMILRMQRERAHK